MKALVIVVLMVSVARADEVPPAPFATPPAGELQSERTALWLSLGGTLASTGLFLGGAALGEKVPAAKGAALLGGLTMPFAPTFGHWYSGDYVTRGLALRGLSAVVGLFAFGMAISAGSTADEDRRRTTVIGTLCVAGGLWVAGTVDDIIQAPRRVHRRNRMLVPYLAPTGAGVAGRF